MELKSYQKTVLNDLRDYLRILDEEQNPRTAFNRFWNERGVFSKKSDSMIYHGLDPKAPDICIKVPTGGGKTFIACAAIKEIFDRFPVENRIVIWLVPNSAIYSQTRAAFKNPEHPYRQRLDTDFNGNIRFYEYEELINGQGFNPQTIKDQLSICVVSYAAVRSNTKEGRRMYRPNSNLIQFDSLLMDRLSDDYEGPSLSDVVSRFNPVVVLDESHNATSELSRKALRLLDPSFILELTATPKPESNIISFVSASTLKAENMVKIPVFLFGRQGLNDVLTSTILFRQELERCAGEEMKQSGRYVRPIALIQAQPKNDDDASTFDRIKKVLIGSGVPENQIALKLSNKDELKNIDLMSPVCPIRYIITVNALREGWDCPFAYILCTLAAGKSKVEVEQIVGRILRQPGAKRFSEQNLNASYVFSSRDSFQETMASVSKGLLASGFSKKDYRVCEDRQTKIDSGEIYIDPVTPSPDQPSPTSQPSQSAEETDPISFLDPNVIHTGVDAGDASSEAISAMTADIHETLDHYDVESRTDPEEREVPENMSDGKVDVKDVYREEIETTRIPFLMYEDESLFGRYNAKVSPEHLSKDFDVSVRCNTDIGLSFADENMVKMDTRSDNPDVLTLSILKDKERDSIFSIVNPDSLSDEQLSNRLYDELFKVLSQPKVIKDKYMSTYLKNFVNKPRDTLVLYMKFLPQVISELKKKINASLDEYRRDQFNKLLDKQAIFCSLEDPKAYYRFPSRIDPRNGLNVPPHKDKSLYDLENEGNQFEKVMLARIMSCDSVLWWHRIVEKGSEEFRINGYVRNHYPDFVVKTKKGNIVMIETKGSHLNNPDTRMKIGLGKVWAEKATAASRDGHRFSYFMVFEDENKKAEGSISANTMIDYLNDL